MGSMRWVIGLMVLAGCFGHPHVTLQPPPPSLTPVQRVEAFGALRAVTEKTEITTSCHRHACSSTTQSGLALANGVEVWHAEDIEPVIAADSAAQRHVAEARNASDRRSMWGWVAFVGFAGSFGVAVVADKAGASLDTIGGIMLVGLTTSVVGLIARAWNGHVRSEATRDAFQAYNDGLARRLGVCVSGLAIVPCETPVDAEPMPGAVIEDPVLRSLRQK